MHVGTIYFVWVEQPSHPQRGKLTTTILHFQGLVHSECASPHLFSGRGERALVSPSRRGTNTILFTQLEVDDDGASYVTNFDGPCDSPYAI